MLYKSHSESPYRSLILFWFFPLFYDHHLQRSVDKVGSHHTDEEQPDIALQLLLLELGSLLFISIAPRRQMQSI